MSKIDDGGPAFPHPAGWRRDPEISDGMSLRDYFAAQAMFAGIESIMRDESGGYPEAAAEAYAFADAMLAARSKGGAA